MELALLLPLVVTLFVSLIGVQRIYTAHIALAGAVREGVRAAALSEDSADRAVRRAAPALAASRLRVEVSRQPCRPGSPVQVTGTYRMLSRVPLAGSGGFELRSTAVMRCGG
ncbi:MAG: TadE/TadG family type IV pilus assembly protein [Acidimicrobiales bacterium]